MDFQEVVRQGVETAEAIVSMVESALHGGQELVDERVDELVRRAREFGGPRAPGPLRDAQRSLSTAAQALSDAGRFERDRKRSRSPDGQKRNWLARNMALSTAKLNAAMAGLHLTAPARPQSQEQLHDLTDAVVDLSEGVHQSEQVITGHAPEEAEPEERQPRNLQNYSPERPPGRQNFGPRRGRQDQNSGGGGGRRRRRGPSHFRGGPPRRPHDRH